MGRRVGEQFVVTTAEQRSVDLTDGAVRLVVVADTHSAPHPRAAELIAREKPDHILHAGDIGDFAVLEMLAKIAPVSAVRGNIDIKTTTVPDVLTVDLLDQGTSVFRLLLLHIAVAGPKIRADAARRATSAGAGLVVCGHSHIPFIGRDRGLTVFNPGSIGPRRMHLPIVFGVLELKERRMALKHIDCETGTQWLP